MLIVKIASFGYKIFVVLPSTQSIYNVGLLGQVRVKNVFFAVQYLTKKRIICIVSVHPLTKKTVFMWIFLTLPLPSGIGMLLPNAEASIGPNVQPHINQKVIKTSERFLQNLRE